MVHPALPLLVLLLAHAALGQDCQLIVPAQPLTAAGLATPYVVSSLDAGVSCKQADVGSFVQGTILDLQTGKVSVYNPLVIDQGTTPAAAPVVPTLPVAYVAALWFGTNGGSLTLAGTANSLADGQCINGVPGSIFGQVSYCNAPAFFAAANYMVSTGKLTVPNLGTGKDGLPCPTTHSFAVVDQDPSDNVVTSYLLTSTGKIAQNTAANRKKFPGSTVLSNGSDERLLTLINTGLGCADFQFPDLADPGATVPSIAGNELSAFYKQASPVAFVPAEDPMVVLANGTTSLQKLNLYRIGMGQPLLTNVDQASTKKFCQNMANIFPTRMLNKKFQTLISAQPSPDPAMATNLYTFLAQRFVTSFQLLNCADLLGIPVCMNIDYIAAGAVASKVSINAELIPSPAADSDTGGIVAPSLTFALLAALGALAVMWSPWI